MGVRLVHFDRYGINEKNSYDHENLINRDAFDQHPIYAITGLQEVLNILEDSISDLQQYIVNKVTNEIEADIDELQKSLEDLHLEVNNVLTNVEDSNTVDMILENGTISADVIVYQDSLQDNAIQKLADGLYVPSIKTEDTTTVSWSKTVPAAQLSEIYEMGIRYSHYPTSWSDKYKPEDCNGWRFDYDTNTLKNTSDTESLSGILSYRHYDAYDQYVYIDCAETDDDIIGFTVAHVHDLDGNPHTISLVFDRQTANSYALWYDYCLPDQKKICNSGNQPGGTKPNGSQSGGWNLVSHIGFQVTKNKNSITIAANNWGVYNNTALNQSTKIVIDLNNYEWGNLFAGRVRYGYFSMSQLNAAFRIMWSNAKDDPSKNIFKATVKVSSDAENAIAIRQNGLYAPAFVVSPDAGNGLVKHANGYYVKAAISQQPDNALIGYSDGLYCRDYRNIYTAAKTNHGFAVGDFIYYHPTNGYMKAKAIDSYDINIVGMVSKVLSVNSFEYRWDGFVATDLFNSAHGYTQGMPLYISDTTPGKVTQQQPEISKGVGYPVGDVGLIISIERGIQYNQEAKIGDMKTSFNDYNVRSDGFIRIVSGVDYKKTLIEKLLMTFTSAFKTKYISESTNTIQFINVHELYNEQQVPYGMNLFIKAF